MPNKFQMIKISVLTMSLLLSMMMVLVYIAINAGYLKSVKPDMTHPAKIWNSVIELDQSTVSARLVKNQISETSLASAQASLQKSLMPELSFSNQIVNSVRSITLYRF